MADRPVIGITSSARRLSPMYHLLATAVRMAGGVPRRICVRCRANTEPFDGLLLSGGDDVSPVLFNGTPKPFHRYDIVRDHLELSLLRRAWSDDTPVLAICRGAQLMNVAHGGTIHMAVHRAYRNARYPHHPLAHALFRKRVLIQCNSLIGRVFGTPEVTVNSLHRQSIDAVGDGLEVTAREANGVVQAIEDRSRRFYVGVQFHPELLFHRAVYRRLFRAFIGNAAAGKAVSNGQHPG